MRKWSEPKNERYECTLDVEWLCEDGTWSYAVATRLWQFFRKNGYTETPPSRNWDRCILDMVYLISSKDIEKNQVVIKLLDNKDIQWHFVR